MTLIFIVSKLGQRGYFTSCPHFGQTFLQLIKEILFFKKNEIQNVFVISTIIYFIIERYVIKKFIFNNISQLHSRNYKIKLFKENYYEQGYLSF
jgi:hypothetical protein